MRVSKETRLMQNRGSFIPASEEDLFLFFYFRSLIWVWRNEMVVRDDLVHCSVRLWLRIFNSKFISQSCCSMIKM